MRSLVGGGLVVLFVSTVLAFSFESPAKALAADECSNAPVMDGSVLVGTDCDDVIVASGGVDTIQAGGGDDTIIAGAGVEVIGAGAGDDFILGSADTKLIVGGTGDDEIFGEAAPGKLETGTGATFGTSQESG